MCSPRVPMAGQGKHWCFTVNNPQPDYADLNNVTDWSYMIAGNEVGKNGTPHLQGYVCFNRKKKFGTVKRMMPGAHIELMRGSPEEAASYCEKDGDYFEAGERPKAQHVAGNQANREKMSRTIAQAKLGDLQAIEEEAPDLYLRFYGTLKRIAMDNPRPVLDVDELTHEWIYGEPGVGKSRLARQENPGFYLKSHNKWWLGYKNEDVVILDDVDRDDAKWIGQFLKNWADHYPFQAETKGDGMLIRPKKIVVTSNYTIQQLFDGVLAEAIQRRFKNRQLVAMAEQDETNDVLLSDLL